MASIERNTGDATREQFDLVIVGGGIYGAMLMLEAGRQGLKSLLLEKDDFGAATSFNNNRIVHGGLRYLQSMHLSRFYESVAERSWFLREFPDLVRPMACLMPLYGGLARNRVLLKAALTMNDILSRHRNHGLTGTQCLPNGSILNAARTRERFPGARADGLVGAALWYDAAMPDCHRLLIETLRWGVAAGGAALNYVEATHLLDRHNKVSGIAARDTRSGSELEFRAPLVVNAAGPSARLLAERFTGRTQKFHVPSLAWNLLLNVQALDEPGIARTAYAVQSPSPGSRMYFLQCLDDRMLVGTGHAGLPPDSNTTTVAEQNIEQMLKEINEAVPALNLGVADVARIFAGQLPVREPMSTDLAAVPALIDHAAQGGPAGLFTVSGVKYTTARSTAERLIAKFSARVDGRRPHARRHFPRRPPANAYQLRPGENLSHAAWTQRARNLIATESPQSLIDLLMHRSDLVNKPDIALELADDACSAFGWDQAKCTIETKKLEEYVGSTFIVK
ncbi:MAG TPA: FAD-dependent oxidoreductase [Woeseiaceae bacterium]|nr:FAD-dependent oxidoreductase [Woeseiaceae bacterium]